MRVYWQNELTKIQKQWISVAWLTILKFLLISTWLFPFLLCFCWDFEDLQIFFHAKKISHGKIRKKKNDSVRGETGLFGLDLLGGPRRSGNASLVVMRNSPSQYDPPPLQKICQMLPSQVNRKPFWTSWAMRTIGGLRVEGWGSWINVDLIFLWVLIFGEPLFGW